jgi:2-polyprenyl-3-methyl-5-hydroxy-6-metoxy-1,4-benzoquinol methylase
VAVTELMASGWKWQDKAPDSSMMDEVHPMRRVHGIHEIRFDGLSDLLLRAHGCSVFDVGCNRGHVGWDFAMNGARLVHGCDIGQAEMQCARMWFCEHPHVESKFEVVDLRKGPAAVKAAFGEQIYDIVLMIGVQHKLKKQMAIGDLAELLTHLGLRANKYFGWNGYYEDLPVADKALANAGLNRIHTSEMAFPGRPAAIWRRSK